VSYTIPEWCRRHRWSRAKFYEADARGEAPRSFYFGRSRRISEQADEEWTRGRELAGERDRAAARVLYAKRHAHQ